MNTAPTPTPPDDAREAVARIIAANRNPFHDWEALPASVSQGHMSTADAILAAGYRRPTPPAPAHEVRWVDSTTGAPCVHGINTPPAPAADGVTEKRANRIADWLRLNAIQLRDKAEQFNGLGAADWARAEADAMEEHASWIITAALAARETT